MLRCTHRSLSLLALPLIIAGVAACAPTVPAKNTIDLTPLTPIGAWSGLAVHGENLHLSAEGLGLLEIDRDGALVGERKLGQDGLENRPYRDLSVLDDQQYLLIADGEGWLYDALTEQQQVRFCVVPGDIIGPILTQKNDALAVSGATIVANPRFYDEDGALSSSELRTYNLSDGTPINFIALDDKPELTGLAVSGAEVLGVADGRLLRYGVDGNKLGEVELDGVELAAGLAVDGDELLVLDAAQERISIFSRAELSALTNDR